MDSVKSGESSPVSASHRVSGIRRVRCSERHSLNLCRGRSLEAVAAASVYATTRCNGLGRSRAEVAACARCDQQQLTNAYTAMNVELELPTQPIAATDRIPRLAQNSRSQIRFVDEHSNSHRRHANAD